LNKYIVFLMTWRWLAWAETCSCFICQSL